MDKCNKCSMTGVCPVMFTGLECPTEDEMFYEMSVENESLDTFLGRIADYITENYIPKSKILSVIDNEPELPGDCPQEIKDILMGDDLDAKIELLRITVRETKKGIKSRIHAEQERLENADAK